MQHVKFRLLLLLLPIIFLHPLTQAKEVGTDLLVEVIVDSSPCTATCGLGVKTQTLCLLKDGQAAIEDESAADGAEVSKDCRHRQVKCLESWQCGLTTMTVTSGESVTMDCMEEVMGVMGRFSWRVSWRYARGIITSDDSLFVRRDAPLLDRVVLNPVREEDAGTYRCDVKDASSRRMKRVYWGIRVLPVGVIQLDYENSLAEWDYPTNHTELDQPDHGTPLHHIVILSLGFAGVLAGFILIKFYLMVKETLRYTDEDKKTAPKMSHKVI